jgi:hypothetical protein
MARRDLGWFAPCNTTVMLFVRWHESPAKGIIATGVTLIVPVHSVTLFTHNCITLWTFPSIEHGVIRHALLFTSATHSAIFTPCIEQESQFRPA